MFAVAIKSKALRVFYSYVSYQLSYDYQASAEDILQALNDCIEFYQEPCYLSSFEEENPLVEEYFLGLYQDLTDQLEVLYGSSNFSITNIVAISPDTVTIEFTQEVKCNVSYVGSTAHRFHSFLRDIRAANNRRSDPECRGVSAPRRRHRPYARR